MADIKKIEYYDLRAEARAGRLPTMIGRQQECERLSRMLGRRIANNCMLVGPGGVGKTTLVRGWVNECVRVAPHDQRHFLQFTSEHVRSLLGSEDALNRYQEAYATLPNATVFIDDAGSVLHNNPQRVEYLQRLCSPLLKDSSKHLILSLNPQEYAWLEQEAPQLVKSFEVITVKSQSVIEQIAILKEALARLRRTSQISVPAAVLEEIVQYVVRFPKLGQLPRAAIGLLDECLAQATLQGQQVLSSGVIDSVVSVKTGMQVHQLRRDELVVLRNFEQDLNERIINQSPAIKKIAAAMQRARLGMRNPNRPLGSFLLLGPSGVGKTETAKLVAEKMFGQSENFIRFDMSEFSQEHTVQRLIGAPAGYVGHDAGGALTNALKAEPHSLILLDEIEKAHPKVFDIFLQVLDDGRLTSGQNETVDARNAIIMATSNLGVSEILASAAQGADIHSASFIESNIMPALAAQFRLEFINRFDNVLIFNPLRVCDLVSIAELEIKKIEQRASKHNVQFRLDPGILEQKIKTLADPRFGARPVKRFVEEVCENLLVRSLLNHEAR